ncbi:hypothetical protein Dimus_017822 [Dionaea muscipula]
MATSSGLASSGARRAATTFLRATRSSPANSHASHGVQRSNCLPASSGSTRPAVSGHDQQGLHGCRARPAARAANGCRTATNVSLFSVVTSSAWTTRSRSAGSGENRRRDDEEAASVENEEVDEEEEARHDFDWEAVHEEAEIQGESGSGEKFYDAEDEIQESAAVVEEVPEVPTPTSVQQKETEASGVDPSAPIGSIPDSIFIPLQTNFERARANRFQAKLERAQAENAKLLALLQQAQSQPKP